MEAPLLLYVYTDWCPHCRGLERSSLYRPETDALLRGVLKVRLNPEHGAAAKALSGELEVTGFPTLLLFSAPGREARDLRTTRLVGDRHRPMTPAALADEVTATLKKEAQRLMVDGHLRFEADDRTEARKLLDRALRLDPRNDQAFYWRARVRLADGERDEAVTDLRLAAALAPKQPHAWLGLGEEALRRRCFADTASVATTLLGVARVKRQKAQAHGLHAGALLGQGDVDGARREAEQACRLGLEDACGLLERMVQAGATP